MKIKDVEIDWYFEVIKPSIVYSFGINLEINPYVRLDFMRSRSWILLEINLIIRSCRFCILIDRWR